MRCRIAGAVLGVAILTGPAAAQRLGNVEASVLGRGTLFDASLKRTAIALGIGGRLGVYLGPHWLVEGDFSAAAPEGLDYQTVHLHVNYLAEFQPGGLVIAGLGYARNHYDRGLRGQDQGVSAIFGFRWEVTRSVFVRFDGTLDFIPSPVNGAGNNWNSGVQLAAGYRFGRPPAAQ